MFLHYKVSRYRFLIHVLQAISASYVCAKPLKQERSLTHDPQSGPSYLYSLIKLFLRQGPIGKKILKLYECKLYFIIEVHFFQHSCLHFIL